MCGMHTLNSNTWEADADGYDLEASLVSIVSSRLAGVTNETLSQNKIKKIRSTVKSSP